MASIIYAFFIVSISSSLIPPDLPLIKGGELPSYIFESPPLKKGGFRGI